MLINSVAGAECRIAIVQDGKLEELYTERTSSASKVSNIYKGRVTNVEPSIQAAFVDFGQNRNGFLHISDIHPQYFPEGLKIAPEQVGRKRPHSQRPPIQDCIRRGQEVVVQMTKESIGTKGSTLTTYLSIPGRLLVLMPNMLRLGVSRKVEDAQIRDKARKILSELKLPSDMGVILRTAGFGRSKRDLQRDLNYLTRLWSSVKQRINESKVPAEIYQESDLVTRTIRDVYNTDIKRIICDDQNVAKKVKEFLQVATPRTKHGVEFYKGKEGLFQDYGLEQEIEKIYGRRVALQSGGSLAIDQTEALVAIDVNSGKFREHNDAETTALKINQEAAGEIARQLRLRDLGGVIIIDFIDMRDAKHRRDVEKTLKEAMKIDRAKTKVLRISTLGIVEMTRQRIRPSLKDSIYRRCGYCNGMGLLKSEESQSLLVMRSLQRATSNNAVAKIEVSATPSVAHYLANYHRTQISELERRTGKTVIIHSNSDLPGDELNIRCLNERGREVAWEGGDLGEKAQQVIETVNLDEIEDKQAIPGEAPGENQAGPKKTEEQEAASPNEKKPRRRGRRGGRKHKKHITTTTETAETPSETKPLPEAKSESKEPPAEQATEPAPDAPTDKKAKKTHRGRRKKSAQEAEKKQTPQGHEPA